MPVSKFPKKMLSAIFLVLLLVFSVALTGCTGKSKVEQPAGEISVFAGSASKPPLEEAAARFTELTGVKVNLTLGGSGAVLSQMKVSGQGDVYLPGSSDYMEKAKREGVVDPGTEKIIAYLVPAISVPRGNPAGITGLEDLARPGVKVALARPDSVCVGLYGAEVLEKAGLADEVKKNIAVYVESCEKLASVVAMGQVDAGLGWEVFSSWDPTKIETIYLPPEKVSRIGYIPAAVSTFSKQKELAQKFVDFLAADEAKKIFQKWGYLVYEKDARQLAPLAPVGGEEKLKTAW